MYAMDEREHCPAVSTGLANDKSTVPSILVSIANRALKYSIAISMFIRTLSADGHWEMVSRHAIASRLRSLSIVNTKCGVANTPPPNSPSTTFATDHTIVPYTQWRR
jgi:hypothetical protein